MGESAGFDCAVDFGKEEEVTGQMTIFDLIKPTDLEQLEEKTMVQIISDKTGLIFSYVDDLFGWVCKKGKQRYTIHYSRYSCREREGVRFISCGWDYKTGGAGSPCDSIDEAVSFFERHLAG